MPLAATIDLTSVATAPVNNSVFTGSSAADDWIETRFGSSNYFSAVLSEPNRLSLNYLLPEFNNLERIFTLSVNDSSNGIEQIKRAGSSNDVFNVTSILAGPGDYSSRNEHLTVYGTTGNDIITLTQSPDYISSASSGPGDDIIIGGPGFDVFNSGPGTNRYEGRGGEDIYKARPVNNSRDTIFDSGSDGNDRLQVFLDSTSGWDWGFERVGDDLHGFVLDRLGRYEFTVQEQYSQSNPNSGLETVVIYAPGSSLSYRGFNLKSDSTNSSNIGIAGTSSTETFNTSTLPLGTEKKFIRIWGNGGDDELIRKNDDNLFHFFRGGDGIDTITYAKARGDYSFSRSGSAYEIKSKTALASTSADYIQQVERFKFADVSLAYDLNSNAGTVAKILGAVFGQRAVSDKTYVGIGLNLLDSGMTYVGLVELALGVALGNARSNTSVVDLLYRNVTGATPTTEELKTFSDLISSGQFTQASLGVFAADTELNAQRIDLVGLAQSGLEYL